jgi:hypothetical protein
MPRRIGTALGRFPIQVSDIPCIRLHKKPDTIAIWIRLEQSRGIPDDKKGPASREGFIWPHRITASHWDLIASPELSDRRDARRDAATADA